MNRKSRILTVLLGAGAAGLPAVASAAVQPSHLAGHLSGGLELADGRIAPKRGDVRFSAVAPPRLGAPGGAAAIRSRTTAKLRADLGRTWIAWDEDTGAPRRILTSGYDTPDAVADPWRAGDVAHRVLADHLPLLAPGADPGDFSMISNVESGGIRSIGFLQYDHGREVIGGQISFRFRHDRLVGIGSEALPDVDAPVPSRRITAATAEASARGWIEDTIDGSIAAVGGVEGPFVLPVLDPTADRPQYHEVLAIDVRVTGPSSAWRVYVDSATGTPIAREQTMLFASGTVLYDAPVRSPSYGPRNQFPAINAEVLVDGAPQVVAPQGFVDFAGPTAQIDTTVAGPLQAVVNQGGETAAAELFLGDAGATVWDGSGDEFLDAQIATFIHAGVVKNYVRGIDPTLGYLDQQIQLNVNVDETCNAMSDGDSLYFYRSSDNCENTGRIADVIYHEFGHSVHHNALIPGVGAFDGSLSEGIADYLSATITGESALARGFFFDESPLRDFDPPDYEYHWPEDAGEVHDAGRIIGGALWDLRKAMIAKYGEDAGRQLTDHIYYEAHRRATDMPTMHPEALLVDDDDGDLSNGTPNGCEINDAFGRHGLFFGGQSTARAELIEGPDGYRVDVTLAVPQFEACPVTSVASLEYRERGSTTSTVVEMTPDGGGFTAPLAGDTPPNTVLEYRVHIEHSIGATLELPDNLGDPWYELYVGETDPLFCTSFGDGLADGWDTTDGFEIGPLAGTDSPVDPPAGYDDDGIVFGNTLQGDGFYPSLSNLSTTSGPITFDASGYSAIRLQYQRWLTVEDGFFDDATIEVDGTKAWSNYASPSDQDGATTHHRDREWRFHDLDISEWASDGSVELGFTLSSDGGLEFGGWTVDALCIVGVREAGQVCGDGQITGAETCDDGNAIDGDGCSATCSVEPTGGPGSDGSSDGTEDPAGADGGDDGSFDDDGTGLIGRGCGCATRSHDGRDRGWLGILGLLLLLGLARRRG